MSDEKDWDDEIREELGRHIDLITEHEDRIETLENWQNALNKEIDELKYVVQGLKSIESERVIRTENLRDVVQDSNSYIIHLYTFLEAQYPAYRIELRDMRTKAIELLQKLDGEILVDKSLSHNPLVELRGDKSSAVRDYREFSILLDTFTSIFPSTYICFNLSWHTRIYE